MSWIDSPASPVRAFDWPGVCLGGLLAVCLVTVLILDHILSRTDDRSEQ